MNVDSFRFLPRSFRPLYESPAPIETGEVWAPFPVRLADARIALLSSAGLYVRDEQEPFDLDGERRRPEWGDPSHRVIPTGTAPDSLDMCHLHVNDTDVLADPEIALPVGLLGELAAEGVIGSVAPDHVAVMGYQEAGLAGWRDETAPAVIDLLRAQDTDGVVLAPV